MSSSPYAPQQHAATSSSSSSQHVPAYASHNAHPYPQYSYWYPPATSASSSADGPISAHPSSAGSSHHHLYNGPSNGGAAGGGGGLGQSHPSYHPSAQTSHYPSVEDPYNSAARGMTYPSGAPGGGDFAFYNAMPQNRYSRPPLDAGDAHATHLYPFPGGHPSVRPKRKQVKNACVNCQKACKRCDEGRPCTRCIRYGLQTSCEDSKRKERKKTVRSLVATGASAGKGSTKAAMTKKASAATASRSLQQMDGGPLPTGSYSHSQGSSAGQGYYGNGSPQEGDGSASDNHSPAGPAGSFYSPASAPANVERFSSVASAPAPTYDRAYAPHHSLSSSYLPSLSSSYPAHDRSSSVPMSNSPALASPSLYHSRHGTNSGSLHSPSLMEHSSAFPNSVASSFYVNSQQNGQQQQQQQDASQSASGVHYLGHGRYSSESALPLSGSPAYTTTSTGVTSTSPRVGVLPSPPTFSALSTGPTSGSGLSGSPYQHPVAPALPLPSNDGSRPFVLKRPMPKRNIESSSTEISSPNQQQQLPRAVPRTLTSPQLRNAMDPPSRRFMDGPKAAGADGSVRA